MLAASAPTEPLRSRVHGSRELAADRYIHLAGITGGALGAAALLAIAMIQAKGGLVAASAAYAVGLVATFVCSAIYNLSRASPRRELLRRLDHAAIFIMIAGTYTPFTTQRLEGGWAVGLTLVVWTAAIAGAAIKLTCPHRLERIAIGAYLGLGWIILVALDPLIAATDRATLTLLAAGGVLYSVGVAFHVWESLPYQNAIWHGFVLTAAACHYAAVLYGVALAGPA